MVKTPHHADSVSEFIDFLHSRGIAAADSREIIADDSVRRYTISGDRHKSKNGVYRLGMVDGIMMGWARSHKQGETHNFASGRFKKLPPQEKARIENQMRKKREENTKRQQADHKKTSKQALDIYAQALPAIPDHPYLKKKQIPPGQLRQSGQDLLIPLYDMNGKLWNIQKINHAGYKMFLPGGRVKACYHQIKEPRPLRNDPFVICEGYATGATIHMATSWPVVVALQANNLLPVGCSLRWKNNFAAFIYAADNDKWTTRQDGTPWNPGLDYAKKAAAQTGGRVVTLPSWVQDHEINGTLTKPTDFNDMAALYGLEEVKKIFEDVEQKIFADIRRTHEG